MGTNLIHITLILFKTSFCRIPSVGRPNANCSYYSYGSAGWSLLQALPLAITPSILPSLNAFTDEWSHHNCQSFAWSQRTNSPWELSMSFPGAHDHRVRGSRGSFDGIRSHDRKHRALQSALIKSHRSEPKLLKNIPLLRKSLLIWYSQFFVTL